MNMNPFLKSFLMAAGIFSLFAAFMAALIWGSPTVVFAAFAMVSFLTIWLFIYLGYMR
jgi:hypothetical protein